MLIHDLGYRQTVIRREQQVLDGDGTKKLSSFCYVAGIDCLLVHTRFTNTLNCLNDRHLRTQGYILRGHDGTGGILRIAQQVVDLLAHLRIRLCQDPLDHIGRHFLDQIHGIVHIEFLNHIVEFCIGKAPDQQFLFLRLHLDKRLCRQFLWQQTEQPRQPFICDLLKQFRHIRRIHRDQNILQGRILFLFQQHLQRAFHGYLVFCHRFSSFSVQFRRKNRHTGQSSSILNCTGGNVF